MKRLRLSALVATLTCIASVVLVAGALASPPEYGRCLKATKVGKEFTGKFSNSKCTIEVPAAERAKKGKFEWYPGEVKANQTSTGGKAVLEEVAKYAVQCASETSSGEYSGTKANRNLIVKFKDCESGAFVCTSAGHPAGELETKPLAGKLVWENEKTKKVDLELYPQSGETFIEFNCEGRLSVAVKGAILVPLKTNTMAETLSLKFKAKHGFQVPDYYEEDGAKVKAALYSDFAEKGYEQAGQNETTTVKNEEKLEVNTVV